ncbi:unnamed protein product [Darwinula stevensoni]|uniref:CARD domain-containing protein n=1 Tax=Darwinula stevensoni TaxID=69355 RepID=A0A7R9AD64_9CRUS|nr:unnamed protein product [Darwinula stevensoni]CAG0900823.1 unnamed protein product [Darwinula stevensoni]
MRKIARIIARHAAELAFIAIDEVLQDLNKEGIISHQDYHELVSKDKKKREKLLFLQEHLPSWGDRAFPTFIEILRQRDHNELAKKLQDELNAQEQLEAARMFIKSRGRLLRRLPFREIHEILKRIFSVEENSRITAPSSDREKLEELLNALAQKPGRYVKWYLQVLLFLQHHSKDLAEELEGKTDLCNRLERVRDKFSKIPNAEKLKNMLIERRTLDNKDARTLKERSTASKTQNALNLWNVLKTKDGRDLPIICCCLDGLGHGDIAQDLLQSTPEELMDYFEEEVRLQWETILDALERQQKSLDESNERLEKITEHLQVSMGANNGSQLLEEIKEMRLDIKSLLSSREDEKKFLQDLVREKNVMAEELEVKTKLYDQSQKELAQLQGNLLSVKSQLDEVSNFVMPLSNEDRRSAVISLHEAGKSPTEIFRLLQNRNFIKRMIQRFLETNSTEDRPVVVDGKLIDGFDQPTKESASHQTWRNAKQEWTRIEIFLIDAPIDSYNQAMIEIFQDAKEKEKFKVMAAGGQLLQFSSFQITIEGERSLQVKTGKVDNPTLMPSQLFNFSMFHHLPNASVGYRLSLIALESEVPTSSNPKIERYGNRNNSG